MFDLMELLVMKNIITNEELSKRGNLVSFIIPGAQPRVININSFAKTIWDHGLRHGVILGYVKYA